MFRRPPGEAPRVVGVVHFAPLPGAPLFAGEIAAVGERALSDARALVDAGVDALVVENFGDAPFYPEVVPPETVAAMATLAGRVRAAAGVPVGVNVLRNDPRAALGIAAAAELSFIRINVHAGVRVTDQGLVTGRAHDTLRLRRALGIEHVAILADVHVKHSAPLAQRDLGAEAAELTQRGLADAVLVTGAATGASPSAEEVEEVQRAVTVPVLVASGITPANAATLLEHADGCIVGSALKSSQDATREVDPHRAREVIAAIKSTRARGGYR